MDAVETCHTPVVVGTHTKVCLTVGQEWKKTGGTCESQRVVLGTGTAAVVGRSRLPEWAVTMHTMRAEQKRRGWKRRVGIHGQKKKRRRRWRRDEGHVAVVERSAVCDVDVDVDVEEVGIGGAVDVGMGAAVDGRKAMFERRK